MRKASRARFFFPLLLSVALFALYWFLSTHPRVIPRIGDLRSILGKDLAILLFVAYVPLVFLIVRAFDSFAFDLVVGRRGIAVPQLLRDIVAIVLYLLFFSSIVNKIFKVDLRALLAGGAVLGALLALALQDTLGNLFAGVALTMEDSFRVGDVIKSGEFIGTVEMVTWRATRIRTFYNNVVVLPNSVLARDRFEVFPQSNLNARVISVPVDSHIPPSAAIEVLTQAASHIDGVAHDVPCVGRIAAFGDSGITYEIKYFTRNYADRERIDASIRSAVWYALRRNSMALPFPVRSFQPYTPPSTEKHELDREAVLERLRHIELLSALSEAEHLAIAEAASVHSYATGEAVIRRDTVGDSMFVIARGSVVVHVPDADAENGMRELARLEEGAAFGEMALLTGEARTADVVALTDVTAIEIDKHALQPVMISHPQLAAALAHKVAEQRRHLASVLAAPQEEEETTILSRVRAYFGL